MACTTLVCKTISQDISMYSEQFPKESESKGNI